MCPLRVILIFLSATLAGFFVIRGLRSDPDYDEADIAPDAGDGKSGNRASSSCTAKIAAGFWTLVDMASGRYLWRNLVSSSSSSSCCSGSAASQPMPPSPAPDDTVVSHDKFQ